jgi:hypothetical protein
MWKLALLATVVGVATFAATVAIGRPLLDPGDEPQQAATAAPVRNWAQKASDRCRDAVGGVRAEISNASVQANTPERAVRLFTSTTDIEGRLVRLLRGLPPSATQQARVDQALDLLEEQYKRDVATAAKLDKRYDVALLTREVTVYERVATQLRTLFRDLGAAGCVAYFDPQSYR